MTTYTFSDFNQSSPSGFQSTPWTLTSSTGTTAEWNLNFSGTDTVPDIKWDAANETNATVGWEILPGTSTENHPQQSGWTLTHSNGVMTATDGGSWIHTWQATDGRTASSGSGSGAGFLSVNPEVTGITYTKINNYQVQVDFTYNNIRVSPSSPTSSVEYMAIKNITDDSVVWSEHVSSAVTQPATRSVILQIGTGMPHANAFGHGDQIQIMHTDYNGDKTDYDDDIEYGNQERTYKYLATGPFEVTYTKVPGYALYQLQIQDLNPSPDNATRIKVRDLDGNDLSDSQGNLIGGAQLHDLATNSTPMYYSSFGLNKSDVKPFVKLYLKHYFVGPNGTYTDYEFHSNLKIASKVFSNFW